MIDSPEVYEMSEWWARKGANLPHGILPNLVFTVKEDCLLCGAFLYVMKINAGEAGLIGHTIINPDKPIAGARALTKLMDDIKEYAIESGIVVLMGYTSSRLLSNRYDEAGFTDCDLNMDQYIWVKN